MTDEGIRKTTIIAHEGMITREAAAESDLQAGRTEIVDGTDTVMIGIAIMNSRLGSIETKEHAHGLRDNPAAVAHRLYNDAAHYLHKMKHSEKLQKVNLYQKSRSPILTIPAASLRRVTRSKLAAKELS